MKALVLKSVGCLEMSEVPVPEAGDDELLVRTEASVICTSDLADIRSNPFGIPLPVILGHEGAGVVAATGAAVRGFKPGDRVATHPVHPCFQCETCKDGLTHLCARMEHFGFNRPGTFAEFYTVRQDRARRIPAHVDAAVAALAEPVAVCLEALSQARVRSGERLLVVGDGPFGILLARLAVAQRVSTTVAGHHDWRLAFAAGATLIHTGSEPDSGEAALRRDAAGGYHAAMVAVSQGSAYTEALALLRPRGRLIVFSPVNGGIPLDLARIHMKELEIIGAVNDLDRFDDAVRMLSEPDVALGDLITHRLPFAEYRQAFALAEGRRDRAMKVALQPDA